MSDIGAVTYRGGFAVAQSDSQPDPNGPFDALEAVTTAGAAKVTCIDGTTLTVYLAQGAVKPLAVKQVWSTGTTAAGIVGYKGAAGSV